MPPNITVEGSGRLAGGFGEKGGAEQMVIHRAKLDQIIDGDFVIHQQPLQMAGGAGGTGGKSGTWLLFSEVGKTDACITSRD